jgi:hypothetical protein
VEGVTWSWNQRRRWRRDVTGQRRDDWSEGQRWVHNDGMWDVVVCGGWRWLRDPG